jgi:2-aminoadipate transaminase
VTSQGGAGPHIALSSTTTRIGSSAIRDLLALVDRPGMISLAGGMPAPETFPSAALVEAVADVIREDALALQYSSTQGFGPLRDWVAGQDGVQPEQVVVTSGSQQALDLLARVLVEPGGLVAMADPGYVGAIQAFRLAGARLLGVASDGHGMRVDVLSERLEAGARPAVVYVVADFDNPTGATLTAERRRALAGLAERYGFVIVDDTAYRRLRLTGEEPVPLAALTERLVTVGTVSKVLCPGLRVGYLEGPPSVVAAVVLIKQAVDLHTSTLAQRAVHHLVTTPGFLEGQVEALRILYRERATALCDALDRELGELLSFARPVGGMFVWARFLAAGIDTSALLPRAIEQGVAFVPGCAFAVNAGDTDTVRLSFSGAAATDLAEAVQRLRRAYASYTDEPCSAGRARSSTTLDFDAVYAGSPSWDIGRPQPALLDLAEAGAWRGRVLDVGCGTGEHALLAARLGLDGTGVDVAPAAIALAIEKGGRHGSSARFLVADLLGTDDLGPFDTVVDSGFFHVLDDDERRRYAETLGRIVRPGGSCFLLCFSEREPGGWPPRRVSEQEIRGSFAGRWKVDSIEAATFVLRGGHEPAAAWLARLTRA